MTRIAFIVAAPLLDYPDELRRALQVRNDATTSRRCECGATLERLRDGAQVYVLPMAHEVSCIAHDDALEDICRRNGFSAGQLPRILVFAEWDDNPSAGDA
jgi:hypothetical protein